MKTGTLLLALLLGSGMAVAQDYVGDTACSGCHANMPEAGFFDGYMNSGHPWKILHTAGETPAVDTWPHTPVPPLPVVHGEQLDWTDVEYVVGNYYWKTRFMRLDGYLYTGEEGETTQWNLLNQEWVNFNGGTIDKPFNCGRCHTTGYDPEGDSQHGLAGIVGSWEEDGVRCEACHGPASDHLSNPSNVSPPGGAACSQCHYRDSEFRMPWSSGFMKHHQQSEDMSHSPHTSLTCITCHDPHRSTVYNDGGLTSTCTQCHAGNEDNGFYRIEHMEEVSCKECHMPMMGKSANIQGTYIADVRSHLFRVTTDQVMADDNTYEVDGNTFWNQDGDGNAFVTLDYACMGCHIQIDEELTLSEAAAYATNIHTAHAVAVAQPEPVPTTLRIDSVYPNPFNPSTTVQFSIDRAYVVRINVYDLAGKEVAELLTSPMKPGSHSIPFNAEGLASGVYMVRITAGAETAMQKVLLVK